MHARPRDEAIGEVRVEPRMARSCLDSGNAAVSHRPDASAVLASLGDVDHRRALARPLLLGPMKRRAHGRDRAPLSYTIGVISDKY